MSDASPTKSRVERALERGLFASRWLLAPFYLGLLIALVALLVAFARELIVELGHIGTMSSSEAIVMSLSLIDLSLTGNLVIIVIFAGYETFVSRFDEPHKDRPDWMGAIDFSGLKIRLIASLVAISAVALLRGLLLRVQGAGIDDSNMAWLLAIHLTFVISGVLLALMDFIASRTGKH